MASIIVITEWDEDGNVLAEERVEIHDVPTITYVQEG